MGSQYWRYAAPLVPLEGARLGLRPFKWPSTSYWLFSRFWSLVLLFFAVLGRDTGLQRSAEIHGGDRGDSNEPSESFLELGRFRVGRLNETPSFTEARPGRHREQIETSFSFHPLRGGP